MFVKTSFINNILDPQQILIKFALKLFVCKCLTFQTHLLLDLRFLLISFLLLSNLSVTLNAIKKSQLIMYILYFGCQATNLKRPF